MNRRAFRLVVSLGIFCITGIILVQIYWVRKAFDLREKQFQHNIYIALSNVAENMAEFSDVSLPPGSPVKQLTSDYYVVNVNDKIDANVLEHYLQTEFARLSLQLDYEYEIYDCNTDSMVYGKYISAVPGKNIPVKKTVLPKWDKYTYYFGIRFPNKGSYLLESMDIWIFSSFVLLVVVIFFGYALNTILKQKRLSELQKDFVNNMTHEFKTPLSTIAIAADTLTKPGIEKNAAGMHMYANIIKTENSRLLNQVEKVLQIASLEKEQIKLNKQQLNLHKLIENVTKLAELNLAARNGKIQLKLNAEKHHVIADELHLTNIIHNLLDNAIKYSTQAPEITIETYNKKGMLQLSISDKGQGISDQYKSKVFEKFFRVPTGNVHNVKGFGLGLSYVRKMVEAHKWNIQLESKENTGSTFTLSIPV